MVRHAIAIRANYASAYSNRACLLIELLEWDAALASLEQVIAVEPRNALAHSDRGAVLVNLHRFGGALASYDQAIEIEKDFAEAHSNKAQLLLQGGDSSDTAALCECLDLVICVDTSVGHLSGGLGKRTWILLARNADGAGFWAGRIAPGIQ